MQMRFKTLWWGNHTWELSEQKVRTDGGCNRELAVWRLKRVEETKKRRMKMMIRKKNRGRMN